jgi:purine-binding chemotaxis protein CheW
MRTNTPPASAVESETTAIPAAVREVLEARARALARPLVQPPRDTMELVTFGLARETYAIESRYVIEVFRLATLSLLPGAKPPVFGITAWRGELLTILDLRPVLGLSTASLNDLGRVIVLGKTGPSLGVVVDTVHAVLAIPRSTLKEPPQGVAPRRDYVLGVTGDATVVLSAAKLLDTHT